MKRRYNVRMSILVNCEILHLLDYTAGMNDINLFVMLRDVLKVVIELRLFSTLLMIYVKCFQLLKNYSFIIRIHTMHLCFSHFQLRKSKSSHGLLSFRMSLALIKFATIDRG